MPPPPNQPSVADLLSGLSEGLRRAAYQPNYLNYVPNPHQSVFHKDYRRKKLFIGGNRAGKTTGGANEDVGWATKRHLWRPEIRAFEHQIRGRVIVQDEQILKQVMLPELKRWIPVSDLINGSWEDSWTAGDNMLTLANSNTITFKTYKQDVQAHSGTSLHWIHFDEPPPQQIYNENLLRLLDTRDDFAGSGAWWMTFTPTNGMDWTYRDVYRPGVDDPDSGIFVIHASVDDNPHISQEAKDELFQGMSENEIKVRRHGQYVQLSGMVFREWSTDHVLRPDDVYNMWGPTMLPPKWWKLYWSIDHGLNNPTAIYWHAINPKTDEIVTFHERYMKDILIQDHAKAVHEFEAQMGRRPDYRTGDPNMSQRNAKDGTSILQEYARNQIYIATESVPKDPSIGIVKMRQYMKINPRTGKPFWRIYNCPELDKELQDLHWEKYQSNKVAADKNVKEAVHKYKDHAFDSCKYFFTAMPDLTPKLIKESPAERQAPGTLAAAYDELDRAPVWNPNATAGVFRPIRRPRTKWSIEESLDEHDDYVDSSW